MTVVFSEHNRSLQKALPVRLTDSLLDGSLTRARKIGG